MTRVIRNTTANWQTSRAAQPVLPPGHRPPTRLRTEKKRLLNSVYMRRNVRRMTQAELAWAVGISRQSISQIECWKQVPSVDVALAIAEALDSTVDELFSLR